MLTMTRSVCCVSLFFKYILSLIAKAKYHRKAALFIFNNVLFRQKGLKILFIFAPGELWSKLSLRIK